MLLWKQKIKQARNKDIWWKQNRKGFFFEVLYGEKKEYRGIVFTGGEKRSKGKRRKIKERSPYSRNLQIQKYILQNKNQSLHMSKHARGKIKIKPKIVGLINEKGKIQLVLDVLAN